MVQAWSNIGQVLAKQCPNSGQGVVKHWSNSAQPVVKYWSSIGQTVPKQWSRSGQTLVKQCPTSGQILVKYWPNSAQTVVKEWSNIGQTVPNQWSNSGLRGRGCPRSPARISARSNVGGQMPAVKCGGVRSGRMWSKGSRVARRDGRGPTAGRGSRHLFDRTLTAL